MKYYIVTYERHSSHKTHIRAESPEQAIDLAMSTAGGLVVEGSVKCVPITKKDFEEHFGR